MAASTQNFIDGVGRCALDAIHDFSQAEWLASVII